MSKYPWTPETRRKRAQRKLDIEERKQLLENKTFQRFLRYLGTNASENHSGIFGWILTGCELFFTDVNDRIKEIIKADGGKWWLE